MPEAVDTLREEGARRRRARTKKKGTADLLFLAGLLLGGPLLSLGIRPGLGLFLVLGGGFASVLRRYTVSSTTGTVAMGALSAAVVAAVVAEPASDDAGAGGETPGVEARDAFVSRLGERWTDRGIHVEGRGAGSVVVWFRVPTAEGTECGSFPPAEVREHLRGLGVRRVVVAARRSDHGLCTFAP